MMDCFYSRSLSESLLTMVFISAPRNSHHIGMHRSLTKELLKFVFVWFVFNLRIKLCVNKGFNSISVVDSLQIFGDSKNVQAIKI